MRIMSAVPDKNAKINLLIFFLSFCVIVNPFVENKLHFNIIIVIDIITILLTAFFFTKINKTIFIYFLMIFILLIAQAIIVSIMANDPLVFFKTRTTYVMCLEIFSIYCLLSTCSMKNILKSLKYIKIIMVILLLSILADFVTSNFLMIISKSQIASYFSAYRPELAINLFNKFHFYGANSWIMGAQHASIISTIVCFFFLPIYRFQKFRISYILLSIIAIFCLLISESVTAIICIVVIIFFLSFLYDQSFFSKIQFKITVMLLFLVSLFEWDFLFLKLKSHNSEDA